MQNIKCGNPKHDKFVAKDHYHESVAEVRLCYSLSPNILFSLQEEEHAAWDNWDGVHEAEMAYERHLEDAGYWEHRADEEREMAMGIDPFNPLGPAFGLMA